MSLFNPTVTLPSGDNTEIQFNNNGTFGSSSNLKYDTNTNSVNLNSTLFVGNTINTPPSAQLDLVINNANKVGQIIKGAVSQSANLLEIKNSSGAILSSVDSTGNIQAAQRVAAGADFFNGIGRDPSTGRTVIYTAAPGLKVLYEAGSFSLLDLTDGVCTLKATIKTKGTAIETSIECGNSFLGDSYRPSSNSTSYGCTAIYTSDIHVSSAINIADAATLYIAGEPYNNVNSIAPSTGNRWAIWSIGDNRFDGKNNFGGTSAPSAQVEVHSTSTATPSFLLQKIASQSANLLSIQDENSATKLGVSSNFDLIFDTTTGNKIGTSATQKLSFWGATPITQPTNIPDTSGSTLAQLEAEVNSLKKLLRDNGLMAPL